MRRVARLLFVGMVGLSMAAFVVGLMVVGLMFALTQETETSPWYDVGAALLFGGLGVLLLLSAIAWVIANIGSLPAGPNALVGMAGQVSMLLGVAMLMLTLVLSVVRGQRVIEGDEPLLRISLGLLGLGMVLIGLAPPPAFAAALASRVGWIVEPFPRMRAVLALLGRAALAVSGGYIVWRVVVA